MTLTIIYVTPPRDLRIYSSTHETIKYTSTIKTQTGRLINRLQATETKRTSRSYVVVLPIQNMHTPVFPINPARYSICEHPTPNQKMAKIHLDFSCDMRTPPNEPGDVSIWPKISISKRTLTGEIKGNRLDTLNLTERRTTSCRECQGPKPAARSISLYRFSFLIIHDHHHSAYRDSK
jgi:hypothetical protein